MLDTGPYAGGQVPQRLARRQGLEGLLEQDRKAVDRTKRRVQIVGQGMGKRLELVTLALKVFDAQLLGCKACMQLLMSGGHVGCDWTGA